MLLLFLFPKLYFLINLSYIYGYVFVLLWCLWMLLEPNGGSNFLTESKFVLLFCIYGYYVFDLFGDLFILSFLLGLYYCCRWIKFLLRASTSSNLVLYLLELSLFKRRSLIMLLIGRGSFEVIVRVLLEKLMNCFW